jgi:hypothetical protein
MNGKAMCKYENREERYPILKTRWVELAPGNIFYSHVVLKPCSITSHTQHRMNTGCCFDEKRGGQGSDSRKV